MLPMLLVGVLINNRPAKTPFVNMLPRHRYSCEPPRKSFVQDPVRKSVINMHPRGRYLQAIKSYNKTRTAKR